MKQGSLVKQSPPNDIYFLIFFSLFWTKKIVLSYVRVILMHVPVIWGYTDAIITAAVYISFFMALPTFFSRVYVRELALFMWILLVYVAYFGLFRSTRAYFMRYSRVVVLQVLPCLLLGSCLYYVDNRRLIQWIYKLSLITVIAFCIYTIFFRVWSDKALRGGDMHSAYLFVPHVCLTYGYVLNKPRPLNIITFAAGSVMLLFLGTRGTLVCLGVYVIVTTLCSKRLKRPRLFLLCGILAMLILFAFGVLDFLYELAENLNLSVRIFKKIEEGQVATSSGRDNITGQIWGQVLGSPVFGKGIYSDRLYMDGMYAHNVLLECLLHFGFGGALPLFAVVGCLFYRCFLALQKEQREEEKYFFLALLCCTVVKLMMSSSYLLENNLFLLIGYCRAVTRGKPSIAMLRLELCGSKQRLNLRR